MSHKIGMHWIRTHPDSGDLPHVQRMGYRSIKLFEWCWSDKDFCAALLPMLPADALILARDHPLSEQKEDMWRDPAGTGKRHADEWHDKVQSGRYCLPAYRTRFLGINEPDATNGDRAAIDLYTATFLHTLAAHGLKGGAFNFSTGHPRTVDGTGDTLADYTVFERSHKAIVEGGHIAVLHIYGTAAQPCVPGHYDRLRNCTWQDVQWIVGECGIDEHVVGGGPHDGFHVPYAGQLDNYVGWLDALIMGVNDPRIHSWMPFTYDFSHPWDTFDVRPIRAAMESYQWQHAIGGTTVNPAPSIEIHLPIVETGEPVQPQPQTPSGIVDPLVAQAILEIESGGQAMGSDGRPIIRFEAHIFEDMLGNDPAFAQRFRFGSPPWTGQEMYVSGWYPIHNGTQSNEWTAFSVAAQLNPEAAAQSISMGAAQIMGFNHARIGYPSAQAMLQAFRNPSVQVVGFLNFLMSDPTLWTAVRAHDWRTIARLYNGSGNVDTYAGLLERKYNELAAG